MPFNDLKNSSLKSQLNIPNALTSIRILVVPGVIWLLHGSPTYWNGFWAAILFGFAFWTDYFDGMIARRTHTVTRLGKILDPMADKLMVLTAVLMLVGLHRVGVILAIILLGREIAVSALRSLAGNEGIMIPSRWSGKVKTFLEGFSLAFLMVGPDNHMLGIHWMPLGEWLLCAAVFCAIWSGGRYFVDYYKGTVPAA